MAIFHSYVSLLEGNTPIRPIEVDIFIRIVLFSVGVSRAQGCSSTENSRCRTSTYKNSRGHIPTCKITCYMDIFPECVARVPVSLWGSGGWGCVRSTLRPRPQPFATVRNRSQPFATVRANSVWPCLWEVLQRWSFLEVSDVSLLRFAWQAWHFVTFRRVLQRVESRFAWQAQYFCDVFRRCVAVFVAGAALWACPSSFFVAGAAL